VSCNACGRGGTEPFCADCLARAQKGDRDVIDAASRTLAKKAKKQEPKPVQKKKAKKQEPKPKPRKGKSK
jgi:hypothetical protein